MDAKLRLIIVAIVIVLVAGTTGILLARRSPAINGAATAPQMINTATEVGSTDTKTFRDTAEGTLEKNGVNGEGTHKLIRPGGPSQTVYLVSSVVDLDQFDAKKIQVWGETIKAQKVGWLMDVGRVKIIE